MAGKPTTVGEAGWLSMRLDSPPVTSAPSIAASSAGAEPLPLIQYCFRTYGVLDCCTRRA